jgi:hypothetical protein
LAIIQVETFEVQSGRLDDFSADVRQLEHVLARVAVRLATVHVLGVTEPSPRPPTVS